MTASYKLVQWNKHKKAYDVVLAGAIALYIATFFVVSLVAHQPPAEISPPIILMRAFGSLAIILLHIILIIGPLARLTPLATPLLYNRRHLGVAMFIVAFLHAFIAIGFYGGFGNRDPISAILLYNTTGIPFEAFGFFALLIFFAMAATSHDFWLTNLSPRVWKTLHMAVYGAYALVIAHVALGALRAEPNPVDAIAITLGVIAVSTLHIIAALKQAKADHDIANKADEGWLDVAAPGEIDDSKAKLVVSPCGQQIAIFNNNGTFHAMSNLCAHQHGPLSEGRIVDGCVTCPWHGYQYKPEDATSPPPYTEKLPTYQVRIRAGRVQVHPTPNEPGTPTSSELTENSDA